MDKNHWMIPLGVLIICLSAMIAFDLNLNETKIPITGQSLAVLVVGFILGRKRALLVTAIYLLLGIIGLPIFAKGASGIEPFMKGSGGFLYGFLIAAYVVGALQEEGYGRRFLHCLYSMTIGTTIILFLGIMHLSFLYGFGKGLEYGLYPFWLGAVLKIIVGAIIIYYVPLYLYLGKRL